MSPPLVNHVTSSVRQPLPLAPQKPTFGCSHNTCRNGPILLQKACLKGVLAGAGIF
jgi:hypothetical protein